MNKPLVLAGALAAVVAAGAAWFTLAPSGMTVTPLVTAAGAEEAAVPSSVVSKVPDMVLGSADAPLTVVEYASYTCPHCANFHAAVWDEFRKNYIDTGKVRFVYREVYFDKYGLMAAVVARCGGPEKYFGISDMFMEKQSEWLASGDDAGITDAVKKIGLAAGLTSDQINACLADTEQQKAMIDVYQMNTTKDKIEGTPTLIINGELYSGEMSYAEFAAKLDAELPK